MNILLLILILVVAVVGVVILAKQQPVDLSKVKDFSEVCPIQCIENNIIVNGNGDLTVGFKIFMPELFSLSEDDAKGIHDDFTGLLKMLPPGTIVHKQDFFYTGTYDADRDSENLIHKENMEYYNGKPTIKNYSNIYLTFVGKQKFGKGTYNSLQRNLNYPFKQPFKNLETNQSTLLNITQIFLNKLEGIKGFKVLRMNDAELLSAFADYVNLSYDRLCTDATDQIIQPISIDPVDGTLKIGNKFIAILSLSEESAILQPFVKPKTAKGEQYKNGIEYSATIEAKTSMIFPLACGLPINHVLNTIIEIADNDKMRNHLESQASNLNLLATFYDPAKNKQKILRAFNEAVIDGNFQTCFSSVSIILDDTDKAQLQQKISHTQTAFANMGQAKCVVENLDTANVFFSNMPGNANAVYRSFINTTVQAACYLNKESLYLSDSKGYIFHDRFGNPVAIDLWYNKLLVNRNKIIVGPSGSGKSVLVNDLVNQSLFAGHDVVILDIGHSYKRSCELNHGLYFNSSEKKNLSFNIFLCNQDKEGNYIYKDTDDEEAAEDTINFVLTIIAEIYKRKETFPKVERDLLKKSIELFYDHVNKNKLFPDLTAYYSYLDIYKETLDEEEQNILKIKHLKLALEEYVTGQYKNLLNAEKNINIIQHKFIVFDVEAIEKNEDIFTIVTAILIELVNNKIKHRKGVRKTFIIDEALNFLRDEKMGSFIGYTYRTFRKKDGEIYLAMQNVTFLDSIAPIIKDSIIINTATIILLDHSDYKSNYKDIQRLLSFTDHDIEILDSVEKGAKYRDFMMRLGKKSFIMRISLSDFAIAVFTSVEEDVKKIEELFVKYRSLPTAIYQYLENKNKDIK